MDAAPSNSTITRREDSCLVFTWGNGNHGRLGTGSCFPSYTPKQVEFFNEIGDVIDVDCGDDFSALLTSNGKLFLWGNSYDNPLSGLNTSNVNSVANGFNLPYGSVRSANFSILVPSEFPLEILVDDRDVAVNPVVSRLASAPLDIGGDRGDRSDFLSQSVLPPSLNSSFAMYPTAGGSSNETLSNDISMATLGLHLNGPSGPAARDRSNISLSMQKLTPRVLEVRRIACGANHIVALSHGGQAFAWGRGDRGQLGNGRYASSYRPELVVGLDDVNVIQVDASGSYSAALSEDGIIYLWGEYPGKLPGELTHIPTAVHSSNDIRFQHIACGKSHMAAISYDAVLYTWGENTFGQLGYDTNGTAQPLPRRVDSLMNERIIRVSLGVHHSVAISDRFLMFEWGRRFGIEESKDIAKPSFFGDSTRDSALPSPVLPSVPQSRVDSLNSSFRDDMSRDLSGVLAVPQFRLDTSAVERSNSALDLSRSYDELPNVLDGDDSQASASFSKGMNGSDNLNRSEFSSILSSLPTRHSSGSSVTLHRKINEMHTTVVYEWKPRQIKSLASKNMDCVRCSSQHSLASTEFGRLYSWGDGTFGRLGLGSTRSAAVPTLISEFSRLADGFEVILFECGPTHNVCVLARRKTSNSLNSTLP